jgi:hypothetical protein
MRIQNGLLYALSLVCFGTHAMGGRRSSTPNGDIFTAFEIPDALCGDGSPYSIYVREGNPEKVLLHFEGGGACWSGQTCFGPIPFTDLHDTPGIFKNAYLGKHIGENPFQEYTYVYLPYCTGDMHSGSHKARYKNQTVLHYGRENFTRALAWIEENKNALVSRADDVVLYGESAGALGVLLNMDQISPVVKPQANKTALIDSAGLHFNDDVWKRFTPAYLKDLDRSLNANAILRSSTSGNLAPQMKEFCDANSDWKVGFTQSTQDIVMSAVFGKLTPIEHYFRVLGKNGLNKTLRDPNDNCSSWIPDSAKHMFSINKNGWEKETWDGVSNAQFTTDLINSRLLDQHLSHH